MATDETNKSAVQTKHKASSLSEDERTPKRFKSMEPDLVVVVGGVEFYHYKALLLASCPLFDNMLSADMKEAKESRVEFPDKDPNEWLEIYKAMDPTTTENGTPDILQTLATEVAEDKSEEDGALQKMARFVKWFDYLGLDSLAAKYDKVVAKELSAVYDNNSYPLYRTWCICKNFPCPLVQKVKKERIKDMILLTVSWLPFDDNEQIQNMQQYLLDDQFGDELWQFLLSEVSFPEKMLQEKSKEDIVNSSLFWDLLEVCGKDLPVPDNYEYPFPEDFED